MNIDKYKNKYFSILGDSISTFEGFSEPKEAAFYTSARKLESEVLKMSDTWWGQLIDKLGAKLLVNNSISGSTVTWNPLYEIPSYGCSDERTASFTKDGVTSDVIIVYLGTNDWGRGVKITDDKNFDESLELTKFSKAYDTMLEKLQINYPQAEIWCVTLAISYLSKDEFFKFPYYSYGFHISEYCEAIQDCAKKYNCKVIDLYNNAKPYDTIDGFHPNKSGMKTIADAFWEILTKENKSK